MNKKVNSQQSTPNTLSETILLSYNKACSIGTSEIYDTKDNN